MSIVVVEPAAAGFLIVVKAVLKGEALAFGDLSLDPDLHRVLLILQSQGQSIGRVVLAKIADRGRVTGRNVGFAVEDLTGAGDHTVDVPLVRCH